MSRFGNQVTGVTVSVADEKDERFGLGWKRLADGEAFARDTRTPRRRSHDEPMPSGQIRRQQARDETPAGAIRRQPPPPEQSEHTEETPTGQIRRMRAQDPFYGR